jgi:hypothetical protein
MVLVICCDPLMGLKFMFIVRHELNIDTCVFYFPKLHPPKTILNLFGDLYFYTLMILVFLLIHAQYSIIDLFISIFISSTFNCHFPSSFDFVFCSFTFIFVFLIFNFHLPPSFNVMFSKTKVGEGINHEFHVKELVPSSFFF